MAESMTIEQKVKHFLTLAEDKSATQDERDLAAAQAERLMIKHAIDEAMLDGLDTSKPSEKIIVGKIFVAGTYAYETMLGLSNVARALGMKAYFTDYRKYAKFDGAKFAKGVDVNLVGFEGDVATGLVLLRSLETQSAVAVNAWAKTPASGFKYMTAMEKYKARREFIEAFGHGAAARIRETRKIATQETTGSELVLVDRAKKVEEHYDTLGLRSKTDRRAYSGTGTGAGYRAGQNANIGGSQKSIG